MINFKEFCRRKTIYLAGLLGIQNIDTHVTPISLIQEGDKVNWGLLLDIPSPEDASELKTPAIIENDQSFGLYVHETKNAPFSQQDLESLKYGYMLLLHDIQTPPALVARILPVISMALVKAIKKEPLNPDDPNKIQLIPNYVCAPAIRSGRFNEAGVRQINQVAVAANNWATALHLQVKANQPNRLQPPQG